MKMPEFGSVEEKYVEYISLKNTYLACQYSAAEEICKAKLRL